MTRLTVIVPTCGRPSLAATLASIVSQARLTGPDADEVLVVGGSPDAVAPFAAQRCYHIPCKPGKNWGCNERTLGIAEATGTHLAFIDDDDVWTPDAREAIGRALVETPDRLSLFRMRYQNGAVLWDQPVVKVGNVSTQMILVPNDRTRLGRWTKRREGDFDFIASCRWAPDEIVWREDVIAQVRLH